MRKIYCLLCVLCVIVASASAQNISRIEYFFNTDPGFGHGIAITGFTPSANVASLLVPIDLSSVSNGINNLYVRARDANGNWSITHVIPFVKVDVSTYNVVKAEYFLNTDPGFGKATPFTLPVSADINKQALALNIESAPLGLNTLYLRTKDSNGNWSLTNCLTFVKENVAGSGNISSLEYFIDTDPGFGKATPVVLTAGQNISSYNFNANVSSLAANTTHNLFIRVKDVNGIWSLTSVLSFTRTSGVGIADIADASSAFSVFPNPATGKITLQCSTDKKIDKVELMDIQGKIMQVQSSGSNTEKQIDISAFPDGIYFIRISSGKDVIYKKLVKD
jgi:hypothetical protein